MIFDNADKINKVNKIDKIEDCAIYRIPSGAVPDGTSVNINISFENIECVRNIKNINLISVYNDAETKSYTMIKTDGKFMFSADITVVKGLYFYYFEIVCQDKTEYYYKNEKSSYPNNNSKRWQITVYDKDFKTPDFFKGGIMYHIFVDRFAKSESWTPEIRKGFYMHESVDETPFYKPGEEGFDVYGGNFMGIIEKLDYLRELNVNIIYLSPVCEANTNHKYTTADFEKIDGMFGGDAIFDRLIKEAGERGIKIILDGVFNHVGDDSVYFNKYGRYDSVGAYQSKESKYFNWFTFHDWDKNKDDYECWWGITNVPTIKKDEPIFRAYICGIGGIIEKWLKRGIGGYRIDVADELSNRMMKDINKAVKETSPESIIIGEVWEDASNKISYGQRRQYLLGNQLDSVMNYPLKDAVINYLKLGKSSFMSEVMDMLTCNYPKPSIDCLMNIIGTHDTMRILTALGAEKFETDRYVMSKSKLSESERKNGTERLKAAVLMQMTLPGIPCIYYGDEAGMEGYSPPFSRKFFPWNNIDADINNFYKKICKIRKSSKVFIDGEYKLVKECNGLFCYKRVKHCEEIYIYVNLSGTEYNIKDLTGESRNFVSLLDGAPVKEIKPRGFDIFA